ncbi:YhgE/Pip domain-containing protein [Embleya scabrispora]|uniref:YhgE/Pip domain-containing protein n=1 Tax=Embleya scabrispora TaxID=159449 RepID=UPI000373B84B|nr:YhgE/Pip family protein [Embleya scabrispora]MYS82411.1 ABC transporter permease [Streptomyces sp. SID5474]
MGVLRLAWLELRRFRGPLPRLVPVMLMLVPTLYGALYLWSNWDPYGRLNQVPVAFVNEDRPVDVRGQHIDAGGRLTEVIRTDKNFEWKVTDAKDARTGLEDGDYHFVVTVPPDFSATLATTASAEPRQATLFMTLDDANGFIIGKMAEVAKTRLQQQISATTQSTLVQQLYGQTGALKEQLDQSAAGVRQLADGIGTTPPDQLRESAEQLAGDLTRLNAAVPAPPPARAAGEDARVLGAPVAIEVTNRHSAELYGRGLAPFFFGIALWVFGLVGFLLLRPYNPRALAGRAGAVKVALAGWLPAAVLGLAGAFVLYAVVQLGLGLDADDPGLSLLLIALAAVTFVAIAQFLRAALGAVGDVVILVLLMLQLTSCGGLYPVTTTPEPFQALHPVIPMTYLVNGLRVTLTGGEGERLAVAFAVLGGYLVVALIATVFVVRHRRMWTMASLKPAVEL